MQFMYTKSLISGQVEGEDEQQGEGRIHLREINDANELGEDEARVDVKGVFLLQRSIQKEVVVECDQVTNREYDEQKLQLVSVEQHEWEFEEWNHDRVGHIKASESEQLLEKLGCLFGEYLEQDEGTQQNEGPNGGILREDIRLVSDVILQDLLKRHQLRTETRC